MADETKHPKIVLEVEHQQAIAAFIETGEASKDLGAAMAALGKQFEAHSETSKKSEQSIKRLMNVVSGEGATAKLNDLAEAVRRMGGVEKLTADQTEVLVKQMERLKAQGGTVPASLDNMSLAAKRLKDGFTTLDVDMGSLRDKLVSVGNLNVGTALAGGIAAAGVGVAAGLAAASKAMIDYSSQVIGVHEKTGLSTDSIQKLMYVASQADVPFEKLSAGAVKLQKTLGEGSDKTVAALNTLGLSLDSLRNMSPDQQLSTVLEKISAIENPAQRAAVGAQLLGRSFADLLPVGAQMGDLSAQAERLGLVMSEGALKSAEQLGDELSSLGDAFMGVVRNVGSVIVTNEALHTLVTGLAEIVATFSGAISDNKDLMSSWVSGGVVLVAQGLTTMLDIVSYAVDVFDALRLTWKSGVEIALSLAIAQNDLATATAWVTGASDKELDVLDKRGIALEKEREANRKSADDLVDANIKKQNAIAEVSVALQKLEKDVAAAGKGQKSLATETEKTVKPFKDQASAAKEAGAAAKKAAKDAKEAEKERAKQEKITAEAELSQRKTAMDADAKARDEALARGAKVQEERDAASRREHVDSLRELSATMDNLQAEFNAKLQLTDKIQKKNQEGAKDWAQELANVANAASVLGPMFSQVGGAIAAGSAALKGLDLQKAVADGSGMKNVFSLTGGKGAAGLAANAQSVLQLAGVGKSIFDKEDMFGGALSGAGIGAQFGVWGAAIGAAAGAALGLAGKMIKSESEKIAEDVGRDFGVKISEELAKSIEKDAKAGKGRFDASLMHLGDMIKEAGGIEKFGGGKAAGALRDLFSAVDRGTVSLEEAGAVFDDTFGDVAASQVSKTTGIASAQLRELVALAKDFGLESKALQEFMKGQATGLATNLAGGLGSMKAAREAAGKKGVDLNVGLAGEGAAAAVSSAIVGDFAAMKAAGMSTAEALTAIGPSVAAMREELKLAGLEGSASFLALESQIAITTGEISGPLVAGVGSFAGALVNMHNMNMLTAEDFAGITAQIGMNIAALEEQGIKGPEAARALAPDLQKIWELQQSTGYAVDATTQALIDQAVEAHMVGDEHRSAADKMAEASERTAKAVEFLASRFGYLTEQINKTPSEKNIKVNTEFTTSGTPPDTSGGYAVPMQNMEGYAVGTGGFVDFGTQTPAFLHGLEAVVTPDDFSRITSTSMLAGAQMLAQAAAPPPVFDGAAASAPGSMAISAAASGARASSSSGAIVININGANKDPKVIADEVAYVLTRGESPALLDEIRKRAGA